MSKYIIARIELPLEIFPDGNYDTCQEHASIEFIKCDELPPKSDLTGIDFNNILKTMGVINTNKSTQIIDNDTTVDLPKDTVNVKDTTEYISKEMLLPTKKKREHNNSTFKNKPHVKRRFSLKNNDLNKVDE